MKKNKAFSLVELSVVILIIGILVAGVTQSGRLIRQIKLSTARSVTASSDVASIRDITAWFEASTEGVFTDVNGNTDVEDKAEINAWRDTNPQKSKGDKPELKNETTGAKPKFVSSGINGIPSVYFDGGANKAGTYPSDATADYIYSDAPPSMPLITKDQTYSMFAVFRADIGKVETNAIVTQIGGNTATLSDQEFASIGFFGSAGNAGKPGLVTGSTQALSWIKDVRISDQTDYIVGALVDFVAPATIAKESVKLYVNSLTPIDSYGTPKTVFAKTDVIAKRFAIGGNTKSTPDQHFTGLISEVIIFDRKLKDEEAQSVMKYLRKKYNILN
jgi:prepilin-type N-terminal cleavage/methylation domain-containing protein